MGIKDINRLLKEKDLITHYKSLGEFAHKRIRIEKQNPIICIDANLYIYKYVYSTENFINAFRDQIRRFFNVGLYPLYIFDGKPPIEKKRIISMRAQKREKLLEELNKLKTLVPTDKINERITRLSKQTIKINREHTNALKLLLEENNLLYISANGEADAVCAKLSQDNNVYGCITDDMDLLAHGCKRVIKIIKSQVYVYDLDKILDGLFPESEDKFGKFVLLCSLLGSDYSRSFPKLKPDSYKKLLTVERCHLYPHQVIYELVTRFDTIDEIIKFIGDEKIKNDEYVLAMNIFRNTSKNEKIDSEIEKYISNIRYMKTFIYKYRFNKIKNSFSLGIQELVAVS